MQHIKYDAAPTIGRFHLCNDVVRGVRGCIGSGKSVGCVIEIMSRAGQQAPNPQGIRKTRWACIRNTYPELKSTVIKTFQDWIPQRICPITYDSPIRGMINLPLKDGTKIEAEVFFLSLDKPKDISKLVSLELTGAWINEAQFMPYSLIRETLSRCGRFPSKKDGVDCTWRGIWMDTNAPDDDHWWYKVEQEDTPEGWKFFIQPGALIPQGGKYVPNPKAENVENHSQGYRYWLDLVPGADENWIKSRLCNLYATVQDGQAIYEGQWNDAIHVSSDSLCYARNLKPYSLVAGCDFGLTPSFVLGQIMPSGQLRIITELIAERMGIRDFAENVIIPVLKNDLGVQRLNQFTIWGDPAGVAGAETDGNSAIGILCDLGFDAVPAPTNKPQKRWEAVRWYLTRLCNGQTAFLLGRNCPVLRKGFNGGYMLKRLQVSGDERFHSKADKNKFSHPHDALQYLCCGLRWGADNTNTRHSQTRVADALTGY